MPAVGMWMYSNEGGNIIREMLAASLQRKGFDVFDDIDLNHCAVRDGRVFDQSGRDVSSLDIFYHMNADMRSPHQASVLHFLEVLGVRCINRSSAYALANDKFLSNGVLRRQGLPVPRSIFLPAGSSISDVVRADICDWNGFVVKPRDRHGGSGIVLCRTIEEFEDLRQFVGFYERSIYAEELIDFGDRDIRVEVVFGQVVGGYSRRKTHSFKTNVACGGLMSPCKLDSHICQLAIEAVAAIGLDVSIVDFVVDSRTGLPCILEVNSIMGIFVEAAMSNAQKSVVRNIDPAYSYDLAKLDLLSDGMHQIALGAR